MFSSRSFIDLGLTFRFLIQLNSFLYVCQVWLQLPPHTHGRAVVPAPFIVKTVLSPWSGLGTLVRNHLTVYERVYLGLCVLCHGSVCLSSLQDHPVLILVDLY